MSTKSYLSRFEIILYGVTRNYRIHTTAPCKNENEFASCECIDNFNSVNLVALDTNERKIKIFFTLNPNTINTSINF